MQTWARCFQVGVATRGIVSTQHVESIHRWTEERGLSWKKTVCRLGRFYVQCIKAHRAEFKELAWTSGSCRHHVQKRAVGKERYEA